MEKKNFSQSPGVSKQEIQITENRIVRKDDRKLENFLSPKQAAEYLGVNVKLIYERIARKEIEVQPVGRLIRISQNALETWLLFQKQGR